MMTSKTTISYHIRTHLISLPDGFSSYGSNPWSHPGSIQAGILKLEDYIIQYNCLFAHDCLNGNLPTPLLDDRITFVHTTGNTRAERLNQLENFRTKTILYGTKSIKSRAVEAWNTINIDLHQLKLQGQSKSICKDKVFHYLLDKYDDEIS